MWQAIGALCLGAAFLSSPFSSASEAPQTEREPETLKDAPKKKVMCSYLLYGVTKTVCGEEPVQDVKQECDKMATKDRGEKTECSCTADQNFIGDACN